MLLPTLVVEGCADLAHRQMPAPCWPIGIEALEALHAAQAACRYHPGFNTASENVGAAHCEHTASRGPAPAGCLKVLQMCKIAGGCPLPSCRRKGRRAQPRGDVEPWYVHPDQQSPACGYGSGSKGLQMIGKPWVEADAASIVLAATQPSAWYQHCP